MIGVYSRHPDALVAPDTLWTPGTVVSVSRDIFSDRDEVVTKKLHASPLAQAIADRLMASPRCSADPRLAACARRLLACESPDEVLAATILAYAEGAATGGDGVAT